MYAISNKVIAVLLVGMFISGIYYVTSQSNNKVTIENHESADKHEDATESDFDEKLALVNENRLLKLQVVALQEKITDPGRRISDQEVDPYEIEDNDAELYDSDTQQISVYDRRFQSEEMDVELVNAMEPAIDMILNSDELEGVSMVASECRSTLCRLEFMMEEISQVDRVESILNKTLIDQLNGGFTVKTTEFPEGGMRMVVFYTKDGYIYE